jgi:ribosomal peptide maturation radical SAM protein 1
MRYFQDFIPRLAAEGPAIRMFWQMKANLRPSQLALLSRAGVRRIQPGIEALDTELLKLMRKGCTMLQNVQILKLAAECGLSVAWNLLYGFPGETAEAYARTASLIPKLRHLQPPGTCGRVLADRFSPYFQSPESFGVSLEPAPAYRFIYPFGDTSVREFAYHFHMRSHSLGRVEDMVAPMRAEYRLWRRHVTDSALFSEDTGDAVIVTDSRWEWEPATRVLSDAAAELLRLCWCIRSWAIIRHRLGSRFGLGVLRDTLEDLVDSGIILQENQEFICLALRQPGCRRAPTWREILQSDFRPYSAADTLADGDL